MQVKNTISINQNLTMTAVMQQSLQILRMSATDLTEHIKLEAERNPLIDLKATYAQSPITIMPLEDLRAANPFKDKPGNDYGGGRFGENSPNFIEHITSESGVTFTEILLQQLDGLSLPKDNMAIAKYIVYNLNQKGYLDTDPESLALDLDVNVFDIMQALYVVQSLEPTGVGARNLEECLILQLTHSRHFSANIIKLVKYHLPLLASGDMESLSKSMGCSLKEAITVSDIIKSLNPIPSRGYNTRDKAIHIIPEARVIQEGEDLTVHMNDSAYLSVGINTHYSLMLGDTDSHTEDYIKDHIRKANLLNDHISQRKSTLYSIITYIVMAQKEYIKGNSPLAPLKMSDAASELEISISTISRAVSEKYIIVGNKAISLKSFFTTGYKTMAGDDVSVDNIQDKIKGFIAAENQHKPLSDEDIKQALQISGINISRRTVAKYRDQMGIPTSTKRKL